MKALEDKMEDEAVELLDGGKLRRAERVLKRMLAIDPNCLAAHFNLARVYRRTKQYKIALYHARRTLKLNPKEPNAFLNLALIYEEMGRHEMALLYYRKELAQNPFSADTLWNRGRLYFKRHRWLSASEDLNRCFIMGFPFELDETVFKLGYCYYKRNDVKSYINLHSRYMESFPNSYSAAG